MLKLHNIMLAHQRLKPYIRHTPLVHSEALSAQTGAKVWLKLECRQPTGSFKIRGALCKIMALDDDDRVRGIVTGSAGNHGLGTAYAAKILGLDNTTIFVPRTAPAPKLARLARFPVDLQKVGETYEDAHKAADSFAQKTGATYIPAYDDPQVITGAGTCGLEILAELPEVETIVVPVGGGGLIAGIAVAAKGINPLCKVIGVQPEASPAAKLSFEQNQPIDPYDHAPTIADGLAGGFGVHPFYIARTLIDDILLFSETELRRAIFTLVDQEQLVVEAAGAIAIAPLLAESRNLHGQTIVCVLSGANIDTALLADILKGGTAGGT
jgi:threonine dehydratase